jgi:zinc transporter ZupT
MQASQPLMHICEGDASAGPAETSPVVQLAATTLPTKRLAWLSFRDMFLRASCGVWVAACTVIVGMQLLERMEYASLRVFLYGWLTCITTGLGAVPFMFVGTDALGDRALALANAVAGGMMLAASSSMLLEAHEHCGPRDWQIFVGLLAGVVFIRASEHLHSSGEGEDSDIVALHCAFVERRHFRKAMLIFTVMFFHSAAEGIAVGVAFSQELKSQFGLYVSLLLAVHNVPEGLAVALVLVPRGVSAPLASLIAILTSVPQPLLAVVAFLFVESFGFLLPLGLAFAAGAMVYVCFHELLLEAAQNLGWTHMLVVTATSHLAMCWVIAALQAATDVV